MAWSAESVEADMLWCMQVTRYGIKSIAEIAENPKVAPARIVLFEDDGQYPSKDDESGNYHSHTAWELATKKAPNANDVILLNQLADNMAKRHQKAAEEARKEKAAEEARKEKAAEEALKEKAAEEARKEKATKKPPGALLAALLVDLPEAQPSPLKVATEPPPPETTLVHQPPKGSLLKPQPSEPSYSEDQPPEDQSPEVEKSHKRRRKEPDVSLLVNYSFEGCSPVEVTIEVTGDESWSTLASVVTGINSGFGQEEIDRMVGLSAAELARIHRRSVEVANMGVILRDKGMSKKITVARYLSTCQTVKEPGWLGLSSWGMAQTMYADGVCRLQPSYGVLRNVTSVKVSYNPDSLIPSDDVARLSIVMPFNTEGAIQTFIPKMQKAQQFPRTESNVAAQRALAEVIYETAEGKSKGFGNFAAQVIQKAWDSTFGPCTVKIDADFDLTQKYQRDFASTQAATTSGVGFNRNAQPQRFVDQTVLARVEFADYVSIFKGQHEFCNQPPPPTCFSNINDKEGDEKTKIFDYTTLSYKQVLDFLAVIENSPQRADNGDTEMFDSSTMTLSKAVKLMRFVNDKHATLEKQCYATIGASIVLTVLKNTGMGGLVSRVKYAIAALSAFQPSDMQANVKTANTDKYSAWCILFVWICINSTWPDNRASEQLCYQSGQPTEFTDAFTDISIVLSGIYQAIDLLTRLLDWSPHKKSLAEKKASLKKGIEDLAKSKSALGKGAATSQSSETIQNTIEHSNSEIDRIDSVLESLSTSKIETLLDSVKKLNDVIPKLAKQDLCDLNDVLGQISDVANQVFDQSSDDTPSDKILAFVAANGVGEVSILQEDTVLAFTSSITSIAPGGSNKFGKDLEQVMACWNQCADTPVSATHDMLLDVATPASFLAWLDSVSDREEEDTRFPRIVRTADCLKHSLACNSWKTCSPDPQNPSTSLSFSFIPDCKVYGYVQTRE